MTQTIDALVEALEAEKAMRLYGQSPECGKEHWESIRERRRAVYEATDAALAQARAEQAEPLFWYRPVCKGEMYEGPIHNNSVEGKKLREEKPGEWLPLFTTPPAAPVAKLEPWQPIETAPKDGRHVLIANDTPGSIHPCEGYYVTPEHRYGKEPKHAGWWRLAGSSEASVHGRTPTHWMPLPPPPVAAHNAKLGGAG